jgi:hypothetical protein
MPSNELDGDSDLVGAARATCWSHARPIREPLRRLPALDRRFASEAVATPRSAPLLAFSTDRIAQRRRPMAYDVDQLIKMSQAQLDELFTGTSAGAIPDGEAEGTAIIAPGTTYTKDIAAIINHFVWKGKVFDAKKGVLKNRLSSIGFHAIIAKVYKAPSWLDGKECIVLDYSETSILAHRIRDEIRQIGPRLYLGKVYWEKKRTIDFALQF